MARQPMVLFGHCTDFLPFCCAQLFDACQYPVRLLMGGHLSPVVVRPTMHQSSAQNDLDVTIVGGVIRPSDQKHLRRQLGRPPHP
ncbi:hypothetical protein HRbin36_01823 [bacterium HR36]|nr:hypothetical protein HRbin36_01823 [bacterium HR36]